MHATTGNAAVADLLGGKTAAPRLPKGPSCLGYVPKPTYVVAEAQVAASPISARIE